MKTINRDKIQRMVGQVAGGSGSGGGGGADIAGYASMAWVDQNYVSKEFFARLFSIHSDVVTEAAPHGEIVEPNDLDTEIKSIEAMFGFWTEQYLSALGQGSGGGGGGGGGTTLTEPLATINESALGQPTVADQIICWDGSRWTYRPYSSASLINGTITIGSNSITPLTDTILKRDYTWWGRSVNANGVVTGTITVGNGDIILSNAHNINVFDNPSGNGTATELEVLRMTSANNLLIGRGTAAADYNTYLYGNIIGFRYGNSGTTGMVLRNTGHLTVNASDITDTEQLVRNIYMNVGGAVKANRIYLFTHSSDSTKDVYLEYDSVNNGVHLVGAGFYGDSYVSALGAGSGGGGGSTLLTEPLASINEAGLGTPSAANQVIAWTGSEWAYTGTVTSITAGTGLSGGTITTSGTIALSSSARTAIGKGETAYGWGNHAEAGYASGSELTSAENRIGTLEGYFAKGVANSANTAAKLSTVSKTLWGNTYWTSGGVPTSVGTSSSPAALSYVTSIDSLLFFDTTNSRVGIGSAPGAYAFDVFGNIHTSESIYLDNAKNIIFKDSGGTDRSVMGLNGDNLLRIGYDHSAGGSDHETRIFGSQVRLFYAVDTTRSEGIILNSSGNVGIGTSSPSVMLDVNGYAKTTRLYLSSSVYLEYDSQNSGVHLVGAGIYTDTYVSALGVGSGGGSGSGITMADVWSAMATPAPSTAQEQIEDSHLTQALSGYATRTWANNSFVTQGTEQTITGNKSFTGTVSFGSGGKLTASNGATFQSVRIECDTNGSPSGRTGEINRSASLGLCLQYDNAYNVDMCHGGGNVKIQDTLVFSKSNNDHTISATSSSESTKLILSATQLYVSAATFTGNVAYTGGSDIRLKDVINPVTASVEDIANVRIFDFRWKKDGENGKIHFGSAAQDWQKIFPSAVVADKEGFLSMDYAGIAVGAVKTVAQEVVLLKKRVAELEKQLKVS